eukprot:scaffold36889_cov64-Attheya_sp.AAC.1
MVLDRSASGGIVAFFWSHYVICIVDGFTGLGALQHNFGWHIFADYLADALFLEVPCCAIKDVKVDHVSMHLLVHRCCLGSVLLLIPLESLLARAVLGTVFMLAKQMFKGGNSVTNDRSGVHHPSYVAHAHVDARIT